uniref:Uncharacterized protein n=1 Tax=Arundo donax TaxID=35708 RepID=A0A0A9AEE4_ARUDO
MEPGVQDCVRTGARTMAHHPRTHKRTNWLFDYQTKPRKSCGFLI